MDISVTYHTAPVPVAVLHLRGDLTAETSELLERQAREAIEAGSRNLVVDLDQVQSVSSAGLRALHAIYLMLRSRSNDESDQAVHEGVRAGTYHSAHLKLVKPSRNVLQTLKIAGFDMFLEIHPSVHKAVASFEVADRSVAV